MARFLEHKKQSQRPRTAETLATLFRLHVVPRWRGRPVTSITRRDVHALLDHVIKSGRPVAANRVLVSLRTFFTWCVSRDLIVASPCHGVNKPTVERSRDRVLDDRELALIWQAADGIDWPFGPQVQLLMLLGCRRDEVAGMRWSELDLPKRLWNLPRERVKNDRAHSVALAPLTIRVIETLPAMAGAPFVFTTTGKSPSVGFSMAKRRMDARLPADMPPWTWHDLRRTFVSGLAKLGVALPVIEKCVNHTSGSFGGVAGVYQHHTFAEEKRQAFETWAKHLERIIDDTSTATTAKRWRSRGQR